MTLQNSLHAPLQVLRNTPSTIAIGQGAGAADDSIAIGRNSSAQFTGSNNIAIGQTTSATGNSIAIGQGAGALDLNTIVIGQGALSTNDYAMAIGQGANASGVNSIAIGRNSNNITSGSILLGSSLHTLIWSNTAADLGSVSKPFGGIHANNITLSTPIAISSGGTNASTQAGAINNLMPASTVNGTVAYHNGTNWVILAPPAAGTFFLKITSTGVGSGGTPFWSLA